MLHELRFYEIRAGRIDDYVNHAGKVAVPFRGDRYGKLLGFWTCEVGAMSCAFNLWEHESVATREVLRAELQKQDAWRNEYLAHSQPLMRRQFSRLLQPVGPLNAPASEGHVYHLRIFRTHAGKTQSFASQLQNGLPASLGEGVIGCWTGNSGDVNEVIHISAHAQTQSLAEVFRRDEWVAFLKAHGDAVEDVRTSLMMPAPFSPWR